MAKTSVDIDMEKLDKVRGILGTETIRETISAAFREVIRMLEAGHFPVEEAISAVVPMEDAARILAEWSESPAKFTKIIVKID